MRYDLEWNTDLSPKDRFLNDKLKSLNRKPNKRNRGILNAAIDCAKSDGVSVDEWIKQQDLKGKLD